jgi:hypothetical protein
MKISNDKLILVLIFSSFLLNKLQTLEIKSDYESALEFVTFLDNNYNLLNVLNNINVEVKEYNKKEHMKNLIDSVHINGIDNESEYIKNEENGFLEEVVPIREPQSLILEKKQNNDFDNSKFQDLHKIEKKEKNIAENLFLQKNDSRSSLFKNNNSINNVSANTLFNSNNYFKKPKNELIPSLLSNRNLIPNLEKENETSLFKTRKSIAENQTSALHSSIRDSKSIFEENFTKLLPTKEIRPEPLEQVIENFKNELIFSKILLKKVNKIIDS